VGRNYLWHIRRKLDLDAMKQAAVHIVGEHDFKSFEGTGSPRVSTVRRVERAEFTEDGDMITFDITANGFLKNMVRNIVGTLVDVGKGRFKPDDIPGILNLRDRTQAGETAPAQGLFLLNVEYEPH
jgi:tRNA pseudouridine38-40 synthase